MNKTEYGTCEKCGYSLLQPSFLVCPICGLRREPEPFVIMFGITVNEASEGEAQKRAQELLGIVREKLPPDSNGWVDSVDSLSESDNVAQYLVAQQDGEDK